MSVASARAQVLISLLFGDKLNSPKIEFGLAGGMNRSYLTDIDDSEGLNNFNLGFYFHLLMKNRSYISTGVMVKSTVGATGMPTYPVGDVEFDDVFKDGTQTKKINYFYVPIMYHYRFGDQRWFMEGGTMVGLRHKATDSFKAEDGGGEVEFVVKKNDDYTRFDIGAIAGAGYKFKKEQKSLSAGVSYYYGFIDVIKDGDVTANNSSLYFWIRIPIGAHKAEADRLKEEAQKEGS